MKDHMNRWLNKQVSLAQRATRRLKRIVSPPERAYRRLFQKYSGFTMVPESTFVRNLELAERFRNVPGCVVECGVWKGGSIAAIAEYLGDQREYFLFDSFQGLPPVEEIDGPAAKAWQKNTESPWYHNNCQASQQDAIEAMRLSRATKVNILPGWFNETLPKFTPPDKIALLRLDGDWYESTMTCLQSLFQHMAPGGCVILDDYATWDGCSRAVHDFLAETKSAARILQWKNNVNYIVVPKSGASSEQ